MQTPITPKYKIGDPVTTLTECPAKYKVYDIRAIHEQRDNKAYFEYKLHNDQEVKTIWLPEWKIQEQAEDKDTSKQL